MTPLAPVTLAPVGPAFSPVAAGLWRLAEWAFTPAQLQGWVEHALSLGINTFDHADIYGGFTCEGLFGRWLKAHPSQRDAIRLVSKCGIKPVNAGFGWQVKHYDSSAVHVVASVERSLAELGTDHLDLLLIHRPDPLMQADELAEAFGQLRQAGKVLHFGVSNFTPAQFALLAARTPLVTNQLECSLLHTAPLFDGALDQCQQERCRPMFWSPLAGGRLLQAASHPVAALLREMAVERGVAVSTLALAWLLTLPCGPVPVIGSRRLASLDEAHAAVSLRLDRQSWFRLLEAARGQEVA
ncbi:aldo/keto reductase [uncultured Aquitalea sp.]|uniref:aldo/keto reductase n=1 Tax=uncultured Aquitalea sp. TaxID=540272 RepID=UPI0025F35D0E|nr:aldo/keto reductase [uncultured Aquitalea sp.]